MNLPGRLYQKKLLFLHIIELFQLIAVKSLHELLTHIRKD